MRPSKIISLAQSLEHAQHESCPECGQPSVPAEGVADQALRGCLGCDNVWWESGDRGPRSCGSVQTMGERMTSLGRVTYLRVSRPDERPMSWREVWDTFAAVYPGRWAVEFFPPASELVDEANVYHLFMLDDEPSGVSIKRRG